VGKTSTSPAVTDQTRPSISALVRSRFTEIAGATAGGFVVRAPGRANLIGEHIDYNGLPVLPMAIDRNIVLMARPRPDRTVQVHNIDPRFGSRTFELSHAIAPAAQGDWGNYLRAAAQAVCQDYSELRGLDAVVGSDLPAAAGLSSSSALVIAGALALLHASGLPIDRGALMGQLAEAERYVGLRGGGMDQAICLGGRAGSAAHIRFDPLALEMVSIPAEWRFVVASSLVTARKSAEARAVYNRRTEECGQAAKEVARHIGLPAETGYSALLARFNIDELLAITDELMDHQLARRFRHVVTEARRVDQAVAALAGKCLTTFGHLMAASHASLRNDYEVSCPELDHLVDLVTESGAVGARLTGAGLGGCIIALGTVETVPAILARLDRDFYRDRVGVADLDAVRFVAVPGDGATIAAT
jgi:galactokinase